MCNVHIIRIKMSEKSETESERDYQPAGEGSAGEVFTQAGEILKHTAGEIFIQQVRFLVNSWDERWLNLLKFRITNVTYRRDLVTKWEFRSLVEKFCLLDRFQRVGEIFSKAGNSFICSSLICSVAHFAQIKWATVSDSLRSLKTNERPWANRSGRSEEMSKWAIRSKNFG